jgi:hypothetical protein
VWFGLWFDEARLGHLAAIANGGRQHHFSQGQTGD